MKHMAKNQSNDILSIQSHTKISIAKVLKKASK